MKQMLRKLLRKIGNAMNGEQLEPKLDLIGMDARISLAFSRAAVTATARAVDTNDPLSWEFSGFSQHGEDGIIDYLSHRLISKNQYFVEIGAADGLENCSSWLSLARGYGGVMVEGDPNLSEMCRRLLANRVWNVQVVNLMVNPENVQSLMKLCPYKDPDVFILDIDSFDYYILNKILVLGFRPKIVVVEYNSAFGPEQIVTVPYKPGFSRWSEHPSGLYYGVSIQAWRALLCQHGYHFLTVESSGVNAFFVDPSCFQEELIARVRGTPFLENIGDLNGATRPYKDAAGDLVVPMRDWRSQLEQLRKSIPALVS